MVQSDTTGIGRGSVLLINPIGQWERLEIVCRTNSTALTTRPVRWRDRAWWQLCLWWSALRD